MQHGRNALQDTLSGAGHRRLHTFRACLSSSSGHQSANSDRNSGTSTTRSSGSSASFSDKIDQGPSLADFMVMNSEAVQGKNVDKDHEPLLQFSTGESTSGTTSEASHPIDALSGSFYIETYGCQMNVRNRHK